VATVDISNRSLIRDNPPIDHHPNSVLRPDPEPKTVAGILDNIPSVAILEYSPNNPKADGMRRKRFSTSKTKSVTPNPDAVDDSIFLSRNRTCLPVPWMAFACLLLALNPAKADHIRELQTKAIERDYADFGHWGDDTSKYTQWGSHSNRLIPVYTFGTYFPQETSGKLQPVDLRNFDGVNSPYRSEEKLKRIFGRIPAHTLNPHAEFLDQTNVYDLQRAAFDCGKKYVFLVIFDGLDWQTTRAAAIHKTQQVNYANGRGTGLHFQDYTAEQTTQFGFMCTTPLNSGTKTDSKKQVVLNPGGTTLGGYNIEHGGPNPWTPGTDSAYLMGLSNDPAFRHAVTDSSCSASSMTAGIKSYNNAVNVDGVGHPVRTIAHWAQEQGYSVGAVSSVPISHATPAAAYAHNVHRDDYQNLTRDLLGLRSTMHPQEPLPGLDVLIGGGYGDLRDPKGRKAVADLSTDGTPKTPFVAENVYLTEADLKSVDTKNGGPYVTAVRTAGVNGKQRLQEAAREAANYRKRLLGFYGVGKYAGHLPYATADGDFHPTVGRLSVGKSTKHEFENYDSADLQENPTLVEMTSAAIEVLQTNAKGFWLMVESGDVDWANHDNNIDNSIGATLSGDAAVKTITDWVEKHSNWRDSLLIVTADHGHYLILEQPEQLIEPK
jgi:alkaline phosphatase